MLCDIVATFLVLNVLHEIKKTVAFVEKHTLVIQTVFSSEFFCVCVPALYADLVT